MPFTLKRHQLRFKKEKRDLQKRFGDWVCFREDNGLTQVELPFKTTRNNDYILRCYLGVDCLNSMPALVVCYPNEPLTDRDGYPLGESFENHCLGSELYGLTQICHCRPDRWDPVKMSLTEVLYKGLYWVEAYEIIKETGETISKYLPEMPMSKEMEEKLVKLDKRIERDFVNQMMLELQCDSPEELFERLVQGMAVLMSNWMLPVEDAEDEEMND